MAQAVVLEGTWEEIKQHEAELSGQWLKVIVEPREEPQPISANPVETQETSRSKPLSGMGRFKGKLGGTQALFQEKQVDIRREERRF